VKKILLCASLVLATLSSSVAITGTWIGPQSAPRTPVNKAATVCSMVKRRLPQLLLRLRPWRQPESPLPGFVIHLVGAHILTARAAAVDGPRTALNFDVLGMTLVG
jgi:hypothetical protein